MYLKTVLSIAVGFVTLGLAGSASAQSAVNRTFVSGLGIDNSTCVMPSRPCRTFAYALTQTAAGGAVVAQNAAEYGPVTITQAVSIVGPDGGGAKISVPSGGTGIEVNAAGAAVNLSGIEIVGGSNAISVDAVGSLDIGAVIVQGASNLGLNLNGGRVTIHDSSILSGASDGIDVNSGNLVANRVTVSNNTGNGFFIQGASSILTIIDCTVTGSTVGVDTRDGTTFVKRTLIANSGIRGINNDGGNIYIDTTSVFGSGGTDVNLGTGVAIYSYANNNFGSTGGNIVKVAPN